MSISAAKEKKSSALNISETLEYAWNGPVAIVLFIVLFPIIILIYIRLKLEGTKEPIFKQIRLGKNAKEFTLYKFRTMRPDCLKDGPFICTNYEDSRITPFGRFLRKKKIDEFLQLVNIIKGDMNFIGPRPEIPHFHKLNLQSIPNWEERLRVKPGISGLAQIDPIVSHEPAEKILLDLEYIKNKSFFYDLELIFKTAYLWFKNKNL